MKRVLKTGIVIMGIAFLAPSLKAQEKKGVSFQVSGDVVSSYVWRGAYNAGASIQPTLGMSIGNFSFTAWGSKEISDTHKEIDLTAAYSFGKFGIAVTDYWWDGEKIGNEHAEETNNNYFHFDNHTTAHYIEAGLNYKISENFPLSIAWNTLFWGADKKGNGDQNYSSYVELNYPFEVKGIALNATLGISPYDSDLYGVSSFAVCNLALGATKDIKISSSFSLPLFAKLIFDPAHEDTHMVLGFTLR